MIVAVGDEVNGFAVDTAAGGRISSLVLRGRERLLSLPADGADPSIDPSIGWGCYLMAPFVGRIKEARLSWAGRTVELRRNHGLHSIHGAGFDAPWQVVERSDEALTLVCDFDGSRWPFKGSMSQRLEINPDRLLLSAEITALEPMPAALGWHPWFHTRSGPLRVAVPGDQVLKLDRELIPTGELVPVDERTDLRSGPSLEGKCLDDVYASVHSPVTVVWPDIEMTMRFSQNVRSFVVCTHAQAVAVEPMTAWPDAIRLEAEGCRGTGLVSLAAGERLTASTEWSVAVASHREADRTLGRTAVASPPTEAAPL